MIWFRGKSDGDTADAPEMVCLNHSPAEVIQRDGEWVTARTIDGATPTRLADRVDPCTCDGSGCA